MTDISRPRPFDDSFASTLRATKEDFVTDGDEVSVIAQHGAAAIDSSGFPGWPGDLESTEPVIETYVSNAGGVMALSDNEPFVSAFRPLVDWIDERVRSSLAAHAVTLDGDAYITASLTSTELLEGIAHMDDDTFVPTDSVSVVAIIGELEGPRIAVHPLDHKPLRAMSQITFTDEQLTRFAANEFDHCRCDGDQLVVFPQFGQLHAGPAAGHIAHLAPTRQLLVYRARVASGGHVATKPLPPFVERLI